MTNWDTSPGTSVPQDKNPPWLPQMPQLPNPVPGNADGTQYPQPFGWQYGVDANGNSIINFPGIVTVGTGPNNQVATLENIAESTTGVASFNGRTGVVTLSILDIQDAGGAPINNTALQGNPTATTQPLGTSNTTLATTGFVQNALANQPGVYSWNGRQGNVTLSLSDITGAGGAPNASPMLTGVPQGPTASLGTNTQQLATCSYVMNALGNSVVSWNGRIGAVTMTLTDVTSVGGAPISSPAFQGTPTGTTATPGTATQQLATTAFVMNAVTAATAGVSSFNSRTGAVTLQAADITGAGGALLIAPSFTNPTANTQAAGTNNDTLATTAFVETALTGASVVSSFNGRTGAVTLSAGDVGAVGALMETGGIMTGTLTLAGNASTALAAVPYQQLENVTAGYLPLSGGTLTGGLTLSGNATTNLMPVTLQQLQTYVPLAGNVNITPGPIGVGFPLPSGTSNQTLTAGLALSSVNVAINAYSGSTGWQRINATNAAGILSTTATTAYIAAAPAGAAGSVINWGPSMTIDTSGNVVVPNNVSCTGVGASNAMQAPTISAISTLNLPGGASFATPSSGGWSLNAANSNWSFICQPAADPNYILWANGAAIFQLFFAGNLTISGTLTQGSDETTKENIAPITQGISLIRQLLPKSFQRIIPEGAPSNTPPSPVQWGFMAQDVQPVIPTAVTEGSGGLLGLDTTAILAAVTYAAQQIDKRLTALETALGVKPPAEELA